MCDRVLEKCLWGPGKSWIFFNQKSGNPDFSSGAILDCQMSLLLISIFNVLVRTCAYLQSCILLLLMKKFKSVMSFCRFINRQLHKMKVALTAVKTVNSRHNSSLSNCSLCSGCRLWSAAVISKDKHYIGAETSDFDCR